MTDPEASRDLLDEVAEEFAARYRRGERPSLTEYIGRYPELADDFRDLFPTLVALEDYRPLSSVESSATSRAPAGDSPVPQLGEYRIVREIGRGGMGIVYEAEQLSLGRRVALKLLPPALVAHPRKVERFRREAQAAARLHHTNIVPVFGVGQDGGTQYYVMQYIEGRSLDLVLDELRRLRDESAARAGLPEDRTDPARGFRASRPTASPIDNAPPVDVARSLWTGRFLSVDQQDVPSSGEVDRADLEGEATPQPDPAPNLPTTSLAGAASSGLLSDPRRLYARSVVRIGVQVADALAYAAAQGVLHRDVKPSNLLLDLFGRVWLTDFGLAKATETLDLTHTGDLFGTLRYLAPERFQGQADVRSDVYALGLTLYEMLTLRPAFGGEAEEQVIRQITEVGPPRLQEVDPDLPRDLTTIVHKAIARDPRDRYQSAAMLAEDLRRFLDDRPITARRASAAERGWRWCRRNPGVAASVGSAALALVTAAALAMLYADGQTKATARITRMARELGHSLDESNDRLALLNLERGQAACEQGEVDRGLLWMAKSLLLGTEGDDAPWRHAVRANVSAWRRHQPALRAVFSHSGTITTVAISPDGSRVLTGSESGAARLWDASTGHPVGPPFRHQGPVTAAAFSPDGKTALTGSQGGTVRLWNTATGLLIGAPSRHQGPVTAGVFSPDGKTALTGSSRSVARLWDAATGRPIGPPLRHRGTVMAVAFSPDGKTILTGSWDGTARLWGATTGAPIGLPLRHQEPVTSVAISPDGATIFTGGQSGSTRLWSAASGKAIGPGPVHQDGVEAAVFSPDGHTLLTGSRDGIARLWDIARNQALGAPLHHQGSVKPLAFSPDGETALTGCASDGAARLWDASTGQPISPPLRQHVRVRAMAFAADGSVVLTGGEDGTTRLWDAAIGGNFGTTLSHQGPVTSIAYSPDGKSVLTGGQDGTARLWDASTGTPLGPPLQHQGPVSVSAFSPDGRTILTGSWDGTARLWDAASGRAVGSPLRDQGPIQAAAFAPDGKTALTGGRDGTARLWDAATGRPIGAPLRHEGPVTGVAYSPDGGTLLTGSRDATARLWNASTGSPIGPPLRHQEAVAVVAFSPDGKTALTGSDDSSARLWDARTGTPAAPPLPHQAPVSALAFSPDGRTALTGCRDGTARLWDASTGRPAGPPLRHQGPVTGVAYSRDGKTALSASRDGTARLWDTATGRPIGPPLRHRQAVAAVAFSPDGKSVLTASDDGTARLWDIAEREDDRLALSAQIGLMTGLELDEQGGIHVLDDVRWWQTRERMAKGGGSPTAVAQASLTPLAEQDLAAIGQRRPDHTELALDRAVVARPLDTSVWRERGRFLAASARTAEADADLAQAFTLGDRAPDLVAEVFTRDGAFRCLLRVQPDAAPDLWLERGEYFVKRRQWDQAEAVLTEALAAHPEEPALLIARGHVHVTVGRPERASEDFARVFSLAPEDPEVYRMLADEFGSRALWAQTAEALAKVIELDPSDHDAWYRSTPLYLKRGDVSGYRDHCRRMLDRFRNVDDAVIAERTAKACLLASLPLQDQESANRLAEAALAKATASGHGVLPYSELAKALADYRAGRFQSVCDWSEKQLSRASETWNREVPGFLVRAMALSRLGRDDEARRALSEATEMFRTRLQQLNSYDTGVNWLDRLICDLLHREAEGVIPEAAFAADPFVPDPGAEPGAKGSR